MQQVGHHYIAESHQRQFQNERGLIWVLDPNDKIFETNPTNIFKEKHYHTVKGSLEMEKLFGRVESELAPLIRDKIDNQKYLSAADKEVLSLYVALMLIRPKVHRNMLYDFLKDILEDVKTSKNKVSEPSPIPSSGGPSIGLEELQDVVDDMASHHTVASVNSMLENAPIIASMKWTFFIAKPPHRFICSDNPLAMISTAREKKYGPNAWGARAGLRHVDVELSLPLSARTALYALWNGPEGYLEANDKQVNQVNYRTARSANYLFSSDKKALEDILSKGQDPT